MRGIPPARGSDASVRDRRSGEDLLALARSGDGEAFRRLVEPFRRELQVHCYRILGSVQDAEDLLQETLPAAWRGIPGYEERASVRTWLYRIATNRCLNALRAGSRRADDHGSACRRCRWSTGDRTRSATSWPRWRCTTGGGTCWT